MVTSPKILFETAEHDMRVASEIILELSIELECSGPSWPHPWDHYPFRCSGKYVWLPYQALDLTQRVQIKRAVVHVNNKLEQQAD
jgi:hypothetical protein